jgi:hypothetical protein
VSDLREAKDRLRSELDCAVGVEGFGVMVKCADLALLLASHDALEEEVARLKTPPIPPPAPASTPGSWRADQ